MRDFLTRTKHWHVTNLQLVVECRLLFLSKRQRLLQFFFISLGKNQLLTQILGGREGKKLNWIESLVPLPWYIIRFCTFVMSTIQLSSKYNCLVNQSELKTKPSNSRQAREMMFTVFCAGKRVHDVLRGKTSSRRFARENMFTVFCGGKHGHRVLRGKTCSRCFARENMFIEFCAGRHARQKRRKYVTGVKIRKAQYRC